MTEKTCFAFVGASCTDFFTADRVDVMTSECPAPRVLYVEKSKGLRVEIGM